MVTLSCSHGARYCGKTALTTTGDGSIQVAWRHVYPGNVRDIAFAVSSDGGRTFAAPVRVTAVAIDKENRTFTRTIVSGAEPALYPVVAATADATIVAWTSGRSTNSTIRVERLPLQR